MRRLSPGRAAAALDIIFRLYMRIYECDSQDAPSENEAVVRSLHLPFAQHVVADVVSTMALTCQHVASSSHVGNVTVQVSHQSVSV